MYLVEGKQIPGGAVGAPPLHAERFTAGLAPAHWSVRQRSGRRAHLLLIEARAGRAALRGSSLSFAAPAALWLPANLEGELQVDAGAQGSLIGVSEEFLTRTVAGSAEALHLRRTLDRLVLVDAPQIQPWLSQLVQSCDALASELRAPQPGSITMISSHLLLLCLNLWRSTRPDQHAGDRTERGDGPRLVGHFVQLVELHYRDGWPVARYAATLGVTEDKLHAHCKRSDGRSPRAIIHARIMREACTRLTQLDLPVEQIGYGLGFRDPGYFNRFFRKYQGLSPGAYRRRARVELVKLNPSYASWP